MTPFARAALVPIAGTFLAGCGFAASFAQGTPDSLSTWRDHPLPPDPALAARAIAEGGPCRMDDPTDDVVEPVPQILVQDRRTQGAAAFLVQSPTHFGDCTVSTGSSGAGFGPPLGPMVGPLTIDDASSGTLGDGEANVLGGRTNVPAASIVVVLKDGRNVVASVANGFWLAWWPDRNGIKADQVIAFDGAGNALASVNVDVP